MITIGSVLDGRYRIDAILGSGGMGRVYRGEHTGIGRQVAIKVLHADLSRNREAGQRFQREALASGRLDHPNIVSVSDFGILEEGPCYLVMEALEGEPLGDRLTRDKRIPWREAVEILRGVLAGLRHAHDRGVVHRDIKPDNVFLARKDDETIVKILDFGIAKLYAGSADDPAATRAGLTVGTPAYLSPEQAVGGEIKPPSDLYSTTILLFEMITGRPPFEDKDPLAMLGAHVSRTPPRLREVAPELDVPPGLEDLIQKGLMKVAAERFTSAADYLAMLDAVVGTGSGALQQPSIQASASMNVEQLGHAPTGAFTPVPFTPVPGTPVPGTPVPGTPFPGTPVPFTPVPGTLSPFTPPPGSLPLAAQTAILPASTRAGSLADGAPVPGRWIKRGGVIVALLVVSAVLVTVLRSSTSSSSQSAATRGSATVVPVLVPTLDRDTRYKALLHDLESGKTCSDRKAAVRELAVLGDERAIVPLKKARRRMRGGVLGLGDSNTNACLKADAEEAIKALGGSVR